MVALLAQGTLKREVRDRSRSGREDRRDDRWDASKECDPRDDCKAG